MNRHPHLPTFSAVVLTGACLLAPHPATAQFGRVDEPFFGITADREKVEGLYPIRATGVSTAPIVEAARSFLGTLTSEQASEARFDLDSPERRHWSNVPVWATERQGLSFRDMSDEQKEAAFDLIRASLSARGFDLARGIMRVDGYLANVLENPEGYGEFLYFIDIFGEPSETEPWGWQLDGHHLAVNYFVMGDQVGMSRNFWGSELVRVDSGPYAGTEVLQREQDIGLTFMQSLRPDQRRMATLGADKTENELLAAAFSDNEVVEPEGIRGDQLDDDQRAALMDVIGTWVGHMREDHAEVRMEEVREHLDETYFAWVGEVGPEALFYYRVQSPVLFIEFDHTVPVSFPTEEGMPSRTHIHAVVRTPNGNDYGKDLLRQHYEQHEGDPNHVH